MFFRRSLETKLGVQTLRAYLYGSPDPCSSLTHFQSSACDLSNYKWDSEGKAASSYRGGRSNDWHLQAFTKNLCRVLCLEYNLFVRVYQTSNIISHVSSKPDKHAHGYIILKCHLPKSWLASKFPQVFYADDFAWLLGLWGFNIVSWAVFDVRLSSLLVVALGLRISCLRLRWEIRSFRSLVLLARGGNTSSWVHINRFFIAWGSYLLWVFFRLVIYRRGLLQFSRRDKEGGVCTHSKFFDWYKINY